MDKKEILEEELRVLEELKELTKEDGEKLVGPSLTLKDLSDPKSLGRLWRLVWPGW